MLIAGVALLIGYLFTLVGVSLAVGRLVLLAFKKDIPDAYVLPLGFAVFPLLVTYGGFLHVWRIPFLSSAIAVAACTHGVGAAYFFCRTADWGGIRSRWWMFVVPAVALVVLLLTKSASLVAGHSAADEIRSVMFTSAFASNALKPAYPFDFSLPLAYPFNLFETSAFLYHAARGFLYPTIPLLATTLVTIGLAYVVLYRTSELVFSASARRKFVLTSFILTFSGFFGLKGTLELFPFVRSPIQPVSEFFHSGYHYLYGACLAVWGLALIAKFFRENDKTAWYLAVLLFCLSFGYAGLTAAWAGFAAIVLVGYFLVVKPTMVARLVWLTPVTLLIAGAALLPHVFSFLPRFDSAFFFSLPHYWFQRNAELLAENASPWFASMSLFLLGPMSMFFMVGPFITAAFFLSLPAVTRWFTRDEEWNRLLPMTIGVVVAFFLLTFTSTLKTDWYGRGFLVPTILCSFVAAQLFSPLFFKKFSLTVLGILLFLPQVASVGIEHYRLTAAAPDRAVIDRANSYPLGTIFYERHPFADVNDMRQLVHLSDVLHGGRAFLSLPPEQFLSYILHPNMLERLGIEDAFAPCGESLFGTSNPDGTYVSIGEESWIQKHCE